MTEKDNKPLEQETESILDFEDAKEMTIGQANRKAEEIEAEVTSLATDYNMEVERVRQLLSEDMLKHDIAIKKAVEVITSTAKVK